MDYKFHKKTGYFCSELLVWILEHEDSIRGFMVGKVGNGGFIEEKNSVSPFRYG